MASPKRSSDKQRNRTRRKDMAFVVFDIAVRVIFGIFFAALAGFYFRVALIHLRLHQETQLGQIADVLSTLAIAFFMFLIAYLYAIRLQAVTRFAGFIPALTAVAGAFLVWGLILLPARVDLPVQIKLLAAALILIGNCGAIYAVRHLGRSFSILPEGRQLVQGGPYKIIRHPVYLAEAIATIGALIHFWSPTAIALVGTQFIIQLIRINYEEKVLRKTFPAYAEYARRTWRLIPGLY